MSKYDEVLRPFVAMMEKELHANAAKGDRPGWLAMSADTCLLEIFYHLGKLQKAVKKSEGDGIGEYAADVANMCMMLADICGVLAIAHPVPPAGGAAEAPPMPVTADRRPYDDEDPEGYHEGDDDWSQNNPGAVSWLADNHAQIRKVLVDRAQVTRLQAEVERLTAQKADAVAVVDETDDGLFIEIIYGDDGSLLRRGDKLYTAPSDRGYVSRLAYDALQTELTKARELLSTHCPNISIGVREFLSNQSAPADKGQGELVGLQHMAVAEDGKLRWMSGRKMQNCELYALPDGSAIRFPLYAEQPAPVAVVMPERKRVPNYQIAPLAAESAMAWNECLDEVARLNSEPNL